MFVNKLYESPLAEFLELEARDILLSSGDDRPDEEETEESYAPVEGGVL